MNNNNVKVVGIVISPFEFSHTIMNEEFYMTYIATKRTSGIDDIIPVMISSKLVDITIDMQEKKIEVIGSWRSFNYMNEAGKRSLKLFLFSETLQLTEKEDKNKITLFGTICKQPVYRKTPLGREVTDVCLAVNRQHSVKSDYLPLVVWSKDAMRVSSLNIGNQISVTGRIQSRVYKKLLGEVYEARIAYETSVSSVNSIKERSDCNDCSNSSTEERILQ